MSDLRSRLLGAVSFEFDLADRRPSETESARAQWVLEQKLVS